MYYRDDNIFGVFRRPSEDLRNENIEFGPPKDETKEDKLRTDAYVETTISKKDSGR